MWEEIGHFLDCYARRAECNHFNRSNLALLWKAKRRRENGQLREWIEHNAEAKYKMETSGDDFSFQLQISALHARTTRTAINTNHNIQSAHAAARAADELRPELIAHDSLGARWLIVIARVARDLTGRVSHTQPTTSWSAFETVFWLLSGQTRNKAFHFRSAPYHEARVDFHTLGSLAGRQPTAFLQPETPTENCVRTYYVN